MSYNYEKGKEFFIIEFVKKVFEEYSYLFEETEEEYRSESLGKYLNTSLSYDNIADDITNDIIRLKNKRELDISNLAERIYIENERLFDKPLDELKKATVNEFFKAKLTLDEIEKIIRDRIAKMKEAIDEQEEIKETKIEYETEPVVENMPVENTELNAMVGEAEKQAEEKAELEEKVSNGNELDKPKQYVKVDNTNNTENNQTGAISIFSIGLVILSIIAIILIAMILNLLLK